ncbi:MAG: hypothetical protein HYX63_05995 [Gammaproteobacteria bacterium]|nr:hypothetical protein [Gammaproteobacteria bacterium]
MKTHFEFIHTAAVAALVGLSITTLLTACATAPAPRLAGHAVEQAEMAKFEETRPQRHCYLQPPKNVSWQCEVY